MSTRSLLAGCLLVVSGFALGCGESAAPTEVADLNGTGPKFTFINGPSTTNVFREELGLITVVDDPESGLLVFTGLPADPRDASIDCGGSSDFDLTPVQFAGLRQAFNVLALGRDTHIHVYDLTTFTDTCVDLPIAQGTGNLTYNDNDAEGTGLGANSFGFRIEGTLDDLVNGGKVRVNAAVQIVSRSNGSFKVTRNSVRLHPIGTK